MPTTTSSNDYGVTTSNPTLTTTVARTAVLAVKGLTPTPIAPSREEAIAKAHAENMSANVALVGAVLELARQVEERSRLLKKQMEAKA
jgi:Pyruvate/2-oxoacid:ferredoxin oxidoreductase gamma subunit